MLDRLGYAARPKSFASLSGYFPMVADSRNRAQAGFGFWEADYPAASEFINSMLSCAPFTPRGPGSLNWPEFCDSKIDTQIRQAMTATGPGADQLWARLDHELVDQAPLVPLVNRTWIDFISKRVGNSTGKPDPCSTNSGYGPNCQPPPPAGTPRTVTGNRNAIMRPQRQC